jgi:hypothetical protein
MIRALPRHRQPWVRGVGGVLAVACENPRCPEQQPSNLLFQMIFQKMRLRAGKDPQHSTRPKAGWQYS